MASGPRENLLKAIGFRKRVYGRILVYFKDRDVVCLTPRQLMNHFIPSPPFSTFTPRADAPIFHQPQFGRYCYDSALLSFCEADMGAAFRKEWVSRLYHWKVAEIRASSGNHSSQPNVIRPACFAGR